MRRGWLQRNRLFQKNPPELGCFGRVLWFRAFLWWGPGAEALGIQTRRPPEGRSSLTISTGNNLRISGAKIVTRYTMTLSETQARRHPFDDVGVSPSGSGLPLLPPITFSACCAHYPGGSILVLFGWFAFPRDGLSQSRSGLPGTNDRSASTSFLSRPAQASLTLRPADLLTYLFNRLGRKAPTPAVTGLRRFSATQSYR